MFIDSEKEVKNQLCIESRHLGFYLKTVLRGRVCTIKEEIYAKQSIRWEYSHHS